jgi:hypothetical protein
VAAALVELFDLGGGGLTGERSPDTDQESAAGCVGAKAASDRLTGIVTNGLESLLVRRKDSAGAGDRENEHDGGALDGTFFVVNLDPRFGSGSLLDVVGGLGQQDWGDLQL